MGIVHVILFSPKAQKWKIHSVKGFATPLISARAPPAHGCCPRYQRSLQAPVPASPFSASSSMLSGSGPGSASVSSSDGIAAFWNAAAKLRSAGWC